MLVLVDTNVLLRIVEPAHAQHETAVKASETLDLLGHVAVIVPQVVYEFWAVATRPADVNGIGMSVVETKSKFDQLASMFRLLRDERTIYERWHQVVADNEVKGKQVHDARLVAAMLRHNISHLLTFNASDFARYAEISVVDPDQAVTLAKAT